ncbi:S-DNA-T family DNA segregation ATPase FtsK/SpoIIIE [Pseudonocardia hierapolitana]|uniref:S-DNA-T family DNA segregation ATPase FtsK/SpoIIIE n=1 Tax=Pseudonocardia hierapolitana TaxID=1128676 RepID=A0A561SYU7_9PSEU|nr:cell division protein FtsK [Pseudonocardia hierapolitana]TWF80034.1 S-DNA-T family DNA segregation ATPase FtsK/SpoIIIE [Pseudonocardia hierapolitana]
MTEFRSGNEPRRSGVPGDDPPTEPIPVVPAPPNGAAPAGPLPRWPLPAGTAGPALEGVILSELESEYVARHFEYQRRTPGRSPADQSKAVQVRRAAPLVRRRRSVAPALRKAVSVVRGGTGRATVYLITTARVAVTHERIRSTLRWAVRNAVVYVATGVWVVVRRVWEAHTQSRYERMMRQAELAGDMQRLIDWEHRAERARAMRHKRRMDWMYAPFALAKAVAVAAMTIAGMLLALGITLAVGYQDITWVLAPLQAAVDLIAWVVWLVTVVWLPLVLAAPWLALAALWQLGRAHGTVPTWAAPLRMREQEGVIVTPGGVAAALAHLGIGRLNEAIKKGWEVEFLTPPVRVNNCGYHAAFSLPMGVTPDMIADRRDVLARNLNRAPLEVWPTAAERAGYVDLWVADPGSTEKPAPPYPLLHDGKADVFAGIPFGVSQRGDVIIVVLPGGNLVFGGLMGQGKSNAARVVILGAALDPLCELWVFVFANNGDFDAYQPRLARYHRGIDDTVAAAALQALRDLYEKVAQREARLAELGAKKVTRTLAEKHPELRPLVALFSECHELFGHEQFGKEAADLAVQTMRRGRKAAITLAFDTQSSRADAIPPKIVELVKVNACFAVKSWRSNDGFLGDGSFQAGIRATELRPGKDVGTSLLTGATDERFEILKWFYIEADDDTGYDAAAEVIERAMTYLDERTARAEIDAGSDDAHDVGERRDLLDDLATVLGNERIPAADVPARLRDLAPNYEPYRRMPGVKLREVLEREYGIKVPSTGNRYPVDPVTVRSRIAERGAARGGRR